MRARWICLIPAMFCCISGAAEEELPAELSPDQEERANRLAESTGAAIYRHDHAAAVATDAVRGLRTFRNDKRRRGWITEERDGEIAVTFLGAQEGQPTVALYRVQISEEGELAGNPVALDEPAVLTPFEAAAASALESAVMSGFERCVEKYNSVVLPLDNGSVRHWVVYLLPGTTDENAVPVGGTYRMELSADGKTVVSKRPFTRSCITLEKGGSKDKKVVFLTITHLLDPTPTEAHVYWSLWSGIPFFVMTPPHGTVWAIENGKIKLVERRAQKG